MKKTPSGEAGGKWLQESHEGDTQKTPLAGCQSRVYTAPNVGQPHALREIPALLEHLESIEFEPEVLDAPDEGFVSLKKTSPSALLDAQVNTADWLKELGASDDEEVITEAQSQVATQAFTALTTGAPDPKTAVANITTPPAVRKIVAMLTAYDWKFVEQAQQIRGKAVAQLVEEMEHPDARIRLKAIELLGKVTEIGLFTERVTVKKEELADHELDERIREKLAQLQKTVEAEAHEREERNADAEDVETTEGSDDTEPS